MANAEVRVHLRIASILISATFVFAAPPPATLHQVHSPYWAVGYGKTSSFELHNNLINQALDVKPVVLSRSGERVELPQIRLLPLGNATLDVQSALAAVGRSDLRYGSAVFEYTHTGTGALLAETTVRHAAATLAYTIISHEGGAKSATLHGTYWFPKLTSDGEIYIAVQNSSSATVRISAQLEGSRSPFASITLTPGASDIVQTQIVGERPPAETFGSVILTHDAPEGTLYTSGWIESEAFGYSNMMTLHDPARQRGTTLAGTQVFLGRNPNLSTGGRSLRVESRLALLNTTDETIQAQARLYYSRSGAIESLALNVPPLAPHRTTLVDLSELQIHPQASDTGSIAVEYRGSEGAVMGRVYGLADGTFGFYSILDTQIFGGLSEVYWTTHGDHDSFLTVANFGEQADTVTVTVTHNGGASPLPPFHLRPFESVTVDVREWKRRGAIPASAQFGGFAIQGTSKRDSRLVAKEHIISAQQRVSAPYYGTPAYVASFYLYPTSATLEVEQNQAFSGYVVWNDNDHEYADTGNYSSDNTNAIQMDTYVATAVGPGYAGVTGETSTMYPGQFQWQYFQGETPVTVKCRIGVVGASGNRLDATTADVHFALSNTTCPSGMAVEVTVSVIAATGVIITQWIHSNPATVTLPGPNQQTNDQVVEYNVSGTGTLQLRVIASPGDNFVVDSPGYKDTGVITFP